MTERLRERALRLLAERGPMRLREFLADGIDAATVRRILLEDQSPIRSPSRGLYTLTAPPRFDPEWEPVAEAWKQTAVWQGVEIRKSAVVCLATAARRHGLITSRPAQVWMALPKGTLVPKGLEGAADVRFVRWSPWRLEEAAGVQIKETVGVPLKVTTPERTVADLLRYSGLRGMLAQEADEALATLMRRPDRDEVRLRRFCQVLGVERALDLGLGLRTRRPAQPPAAPADGASEEPNAFPDFDDGDFGGFGGFDDPDSDVATAPGGGAEEAGFPLDDAFPDFGDEEDTEEPEPGPGGGLRR